MSGWLQRGEGNSSCSSPSGKREGRGGECLLRGGEATCNPRPVALLLHPRSSRSSNSPMDDCRACQGLRAVVRAASTAKLSAMRLCKAPRVGARQSVRLSTLPMARLSPSNRPQAVVCCQELRGGMNKRIDTPQVLPLHAPSEFQALFQSRALLFGPQLPSRGFRCRLLPDPCVLACGDRKDASSSRPEGKGWDKGSGLCFFQPPVPPPPPHPPENCPPATELQV